MNKEAVPKQALKQKRFHEHYCSDRHNGIEDWVITLIDSADTLKELRKKELYWMYKLKTYVPYGLNERDYLFKFSSFLKNFILHLVIIYLNPIIIFLLLLFMSFLSLLLL